MTLLLRFNVRGVSSPSSRSGFRRAGGRRCLPMSSTIRKGACRWSLVLIACSRLSQQAQTTIPPVVLPTPPGWPIEWAKLQPKLTIQLPKRALQSMKLAFNA